MKKKKIFLDIRRNLSSKKLNSQESISFINNKKHFKNRIKSKLIEKGNRSIIYEKISLLSFQSGKNTHYQGKLKNNTNIASNLISTNSTNFIRTKNNLNNRNSYPSLISNNILKTENKFYLNEKNNPFILIKKETNYNKISKNNVYHIYPNNINRKITVFNNVKSILEKKIKIVKQPKTYESIIKKNNIINNIKKNKVESELEYRYQKMFERRLPLNNLRCYQSILFDENDNPKSSTQYEPKINKNNSFINSNQKNESNTYIKSNFQIGYQYIDNNDERICKTIEMNGNNNKVINKFPNHKIKNKSEKEDFHNIMKHPLSQEFYAYNFMRNLKNNYIIYKNPFNDKDFAKKIRNLIINPNTKQFRNGNLVYISTGTYKERKVSAPPINYKLLSKKGFLQIRKNKFTKIQKEIEEKAKNLEKIKGKINSLMERNKKIYKDKKQEIDKETN